MKPIVIPDPKERNARKKLQTLIDRIILKCTQKSVGAGWVAEAGHYDESDAQVTDVMFVGTDSRLIFENDGSISIVDNDRASRPKRRKLCGGWRTGVIMVLRQFHSQDVALWRESQRCVRHAKQFLDDLL